MEEQVAQIIEVIPTETMEMVELVGKYLLEVLLMAEMVGTTTATKEVGSHVVMVELVGKYLLEEFLTEEREVTVM
jgi:hypothetical protein